MKKTILIISIIFSFSSIANCIPEYKSYIGKSYLKSALSTTATPFGAYASFFTFVVGGWGGSMPVLVTGMISTTGTVTMFGKGLSHFSNAVSLSFANKLLKEAEVGMGKNLTDLAEQLSEELDQNVDEQIVSEILMTGNNNRNFCQEGLKHPYNTKELYLYVRANL